MNRLGAVITLVAILSFTNRSAHNNILAQQSNGNPCQGGGCYVIGNQTWLDDGDGERESGEAPLANVVVRLYRADPYGITFGTAIAQQTTGTNGLYQFDVQLGFYVVQFTPPGDVSASSGYVFAPNNPENTIPEANDSDADTLTGRTEAIEVTLNTSDNATKWDAGFVLQDCTTIGNRIWKDVQQDGVYTGADTPIQGATVELLEYAFTGLGFDWVVDQSTVTGPTGNYEFCSMGGWHLINIKGTGFVPSPFYEIDVESSDHDNNCQQNPEALREGLIGDGSTNKFWVGPSIGYKVDCGFVCTTSTIDMMLVVDVSGSVDTWLPRAKESAQALVERMHANPSFRAGVVSFDGDAVLHSGLTNNISQLTSAISALQRRTQPQGTNIGAGIDEATQQLTDTSRSRTIVLLSDGDPNLPISPGGFEYAVQKANAAKSQGIKLVGIGLGGTGFLSQIATDGLYRLRPKKDSESTWDYASYMRSTIDTVFRAMQARLCGTTTRPFECTGANIIDVVDVTTGLSVTNGRDNNWSFTNPPEMSPLDENNREDAFIVTPVPPAMGNVLGAKWISVSATGAVTLSGATTENFFAFPFSIENPVETIDVDLTARGDDQIFKASIDSRAIDGSGGGRSDSGEPLVVKKAITGLSTTNPHTLVIGIRDAGATPGHLGLAVDGQIRACRSKTMLVNPVPVPNVRLALKDRCTAADWIDYDEMKKTYPEYKKPHTPKREIGPDGVEKFCLKMATAVCEQSSPETPPGGAYCWPETDGAWITDCTACSTHWRYHPNVDLTAARYASIHTLTTSSPHPFTKWVHPLFLDQSIDVESFGTYTAADYSTLSIDGVEIDSINRAEMWYNKCQAGGSDGVPLPWKGVEGNFLWVSRKLEAAPQTCNISMPTPTPSP